jgi:hypothetical protein
VDLLSSPEKDQNGELLHCLRFMHIVDMKSWNRVIRASPMVGTGWVCGDYGASNEGVA